MPYNKIKSWVKCPKCNQTVPYEDWPNKHKCGVKDDETLNFLNLSHKEALQYYCDNPKEIEPGLIILFKELPIYRGRLDLVGRDKNGGICLIEVVHRSKWDRNAWISKLHSYNKYLTRMGEVLFKVQRQSYRLLLKHSGKLTEDVTLIHPAFKKIKKHMKSIPQDKGEKIKNNHDAENCFVCPNFETGNENGYCKFYKWLIAMSHAKLVAVCR